MWRSTAKHPLCPACRRSGYNETRADSGRPLFTCQSCDNQWTNGDDGGEWRVSPQLDDERADEMRRIRASHGWGYKALAKHFGVNETTARNIILGRIWNEDGRWPRRPYSTEEKETRRKPQ